MTHGGCSQHLGVLTNNMTPAAAAKFSIAISRRYRIFASAINKPVLKTLGYVLEPRV